MPEYVGYIKKFLDEKEQVQVGDIVFSFPHDLYINVRNHFFVREKVLVEIGEGGLVKNVVSRQNDDF